MSNFHSYECNAGSPRKDSNHKKIKHKAYAVIQICVCYFNPRYNCALLYKFKRIGNTCTPNSPLEFFKNQKTVEENIRCRNMQTTHLGKTKTTKLNSIISQTELIYDQSVVCGVLFNGKMIVVTLLLITQRCDDAAFQSTKMYARVHPVNVCLLFQGKKNKTRAFRNHWEGSRIW